MSKQLKHLHVLVKGKIKTPNALSTHGLKNWLDKAVRGQKLEPVIGPNVVQVDDEGNEGPTGSVNIKTSHMAFHIWDKQGLIQADLYTCGEIDLNKFLLEFMIFDPTELEYLLIDRADGFKIVEAGQLPADFLRGYL
jgi:S-adenosylmethionine/arginine decarboxylase-like enzyme